MKLCPTCNNQFADDQKFCPNDGSALRSAGGAADLVGSVIGGNFHIIKKLGEGGMGAVYLGEHVKMGRKCAIKVMTQSMANDPDAIARFNREATNAARINHPNVCAIYDFGEKDGLIFLAMEFIEGGSLTSVIEAQGALQPGRAARIIQQAGDALAAAHELGIVHRDLKPDNIMIARARDGGDLVKVVDFGIAKAVAGGAEEGQKVTKTGLVVGTPEYMSPEQLSGDKLDGRSDIYSLALVFFRMLTGTLPFQADSAQETMIKRLTDDPMPLNQAMPGASFPARLQQVMDRALSRMPQERYASAAEFARDAAKALEGVIQAPGITEGATQLMDTAKTAQIAQTQVSANKPATRTPETPMPRPSVSVPAPQKRRSTALAASVVGVLVLGGGIGYALFAGNGNGSATAGGPGGKAPATDNPAGKQANRNPTGGTRNPPGTQTQTVTPGGQTGNPQNPPVAAAAIDAAAINAELGRLLEESEKPENQSRVRQRATDIYSDGKIPRDLRGEAASLIAQVYLDQGDADQACTWIVNALSQRPGWDSYLKIKQRMGCS